MIFEALRKFARFEVLCLRDSSIVRFLLVVLSFVVSQHCEVFFFVCGVVCCCRCAVCLLCSVGVVSFWHCVDFFFFLECVYTLFYLFKVLFVLSLHLRLMMFFCNICSPWCGSAQARHYFRGDDERYRANKWYLFCITFVFINFFF